MRAKTVHRLLAVTWFPVLMLAVPMIAAATEDDGWQTEFEASGGQRTPRYDQTRDYCQRMAAASPWLTFTSFGMTPRGRDLMLVIADREGRTTPAAVRAGDNAVLLIQCCIHAGESDGKDAGLMLLRDIAIRDLRPELLDHVTILFMPIFNADGHERFGALNRPNQNGPEQMGWRVTARNLNLNRDFMKADSAEMRHWLSLFTTWLPDFFIDSHVSDGADFQYTLMYDLPLRGNMESDLTAWTKSKYLAELDRSCRNKGWGLLPYGGFRRHHDPRSGMNLWLSGPRFSHSYAALQNRPGLLLETHVLKPYAERVAATYDVFLATLEILNREHAILREHVARADSATASETYGQTPFPLTFRRSETDSTWLDFAGYEYEMVVSDITGGVYPVFQPDRPRTYHIPVFGAFDSEITTRVPAAYLIPPEWADIIDLLARHGVEIRTLKRERRLSVTSVSFGDVAWEERPYEGRHRLSYETAPLHEERTLPAGTALVVLDQRTARVILHALAPDGPDSFVSWGMFDPIFERKEYIENYILEPRLPGMLAEDPELAAAWRLAREENPVLQENPWAALMWFYRRTPWWDDRIGVYPVCWVYDHRIVDELLSE